MNWLFLWRKAEFSLLMSSVSHHPSEIILICWFVAQESFLIIINVEKVVLLNIFVEIMIQFQYFWLIESAKEHNLFEIEQFVTL